LFDKSQHRQLKVETDWNTAKPYGEAVFKQSLADCLEEYEDLSAKTIDNIYNHLATFVRRKKNRTITRKGENRRFVQPGAT
jgi:hypothetical protein